ncbi:accessory Sec system protein Asp2 [Staphylococcus edaphicus]|uniref:XcbB/CpsF family capsular polysaccharide biosynthesis protein n=1 Tax=Staphylococcus edaphicus TaxID=1955013 RepID=A0ABY4QCV6_9STAP|nr:accessory Sec system protein Asp2 [Staphylococcus edaphicus]UQW81257.1 XcbB/CpsF family capsular polysaccharide biosynthesis protein [Staphylococcus edaphicus]
MTIKIATIGSCITRDNFNTKINPNYKKFFNVIAHQNQTTMLSLMSEKMSLSVNNDFLNKSPYIQTMIYKEYSKEFLTIITKEKPDFLLLDFDPDIKFGIKKISNTHFISNNPNYEDIHSSNGVETLNIVENYEEYMKLWKKSIDEFFNFMKNEIPSCKVILVKARFSNEFSDGSTLNEYRVKNGFSIQDIEVMNSKWDKLDSYVCNNYDVLELDMTSKKYYLDKNHLWGAYYLHYELQFYNDFLNKLIKITNIKDSEGLFLKDGEKTVQRLYVGYDYEILNTKIVEVVLNTSENIIELARKNTDIYNLYKILLLNDYILYYHNDGTSKLYKRSYIKELWKRKDLHQYNNNFYTLDAPKDKKLNSADENIKLLVIFTCMPPMDVYDNYLMTNRMFPKFFDGIERSIVKNVYIMRIMDLNCSHGSHYINTVNNPNFENDIIGSIKSVQSKLNIKNDDVVLYGASKGGTGSLYYASKLDYKCLAVDPIISLEEYNLKDEHFLKDLRKEDITEDINNYLSCQSNSENKRKECKNNK